MPDGNRTLHCFLRECMAQERLWLKDFLTPRQDSIYRWAYVSDMGILDTAGIFKDWAACVSAMAEAAPPNDVPTEIVVFKEQVNVPFGTMYTVRTNAKGRIYDIAMPKERLDEDAAALMLCTFDEMAVDIPLPFRSGDILSMPPVGTDGGCLAVFGSLHRETDGYTVSWEGKIRRGLPLRYLSLEDTFPEPAGMSAVVYPLSAYVRGHIDFLDFAYAFYTIYAQERIRLDGEYLQYKAERDEVSASVITP